MSADSLGARHVIYLSTERDSRVLSLLILTSELGMSQKEDKEVLKLLVQRAARGFYEPKFTIALDQLVRHRVYVCVYLVDFVLICFLA